MPGHADRESLGENFANKIMQHVSGANGRYVRDQAGRVHVVLGGQRIPLLASAENYALKSFFQSICGVSTLSREAQVAIERLQVKAWEDAGTFQLRHFSALSDDGERLYLPLPDGQVLRISEKGVVEKVNGEGSDNLWIEHPEDSPLVYSGRNARPGLDVFERLIVDTQACEVPEMRWFVAMAEGLFPYIREVCPNRFLVVHTGPSQKAGKTSGAQRFTLLHGLGEVKGDWTVAALGNAPDCGLLVLDNKEQVNLTRDLIDFLLFLSTGARRGRSDPSGGLRVSGGRPVGVLTSIEGMWKSELQNRCVEIDYRVVGEPMRRAETERFIRQQRHEIQSALVQVLYRYFVLRGSQRWPNPVPGFEEHFTALCDLVHAYGAVAGKSSSWSDGLVHKWDTVLRAREVSENELEHPLSRILEASQIFRRIDLVHGGQSGTLHIAKVGAVLTALQGLSPRIDVLPRNASGFAKRLNSLSFDGFTYLKTDTPGVDALKRTRSEKPIGFFVPKSTPG
jgi:hypothetical protein